MNFNTQQQYDASPERCDIMVLNVYEAPVLEKGIPVRMEMMIEYTIPGSEQDYRNIRPVRELLDVEHIDDPDSAIHNIAKSRAAAIQRDLAQRKSQAGTPEGQLSLESWAGLTVTQCAALRKAGIRSLQELAEASEPTKARMHIQNVNKLIDHCKMYLGSMDKTFAAAAIAEAKEENDLLRSRVADMEAKFAELLTQLGGSATPDEGPKAKRPYRRASAEPVAAAETAEPDLEVAA